MTNDQLSLVRSLLTEILRRQGPQPGSRLKAQLLFAYLAKTGQQFHERLLGFPKFSQLLDAQLDILVVERPSAGPGDVIVHLREPAYAPPRSNGPSQGTRDGVHRAMGSGAPSLAFGAMGAPSIAAPRTQTFPISKPLWSAFINPDPNRERYFHRATGEVLTFSRVSTKPVDAMLRQRFEMLRGDCVPIQFVRFDEQVEWMEEFIRTHLPGDEHEVAFAEVRRLNQWTAQTGFLNLLGLERAEDWRKFRFEMLIGRIRDWLGSNNLPESVMLTASAPPSAISLHPAIAPNASKIGDGYVSQPTNAPTTSAARPSTRDILHALIDTLPDDQLDRVLVPGSAVARLSSILRSVRG